MKKNRVSDEQPPLPNGAVRGDVSKQHFCRYHNSGKAFYVDEARTCVQCGEDFVFYAQEQKYWYETLAFHLDSQCIRCLACRKLRRSQFALGQQIGNARKELKSKPDDPRVQLELASATVRLHERGGGGDLNEAIAAARKAHDIWPESAEPLFWEAKAQQLAGRDAKANDLFARFLEVGRKVHRLAKLVAEAEELRRK